jgi:hypothetical protein
VLVGLLLVAALVLAALLVVTVRKGLPPPSPPTLDVRPLVIPFPNPDVFTVRGFDFYVRLDPSRRREMLDVIRTAIGEKGTLYDQDTYGVVLWHDFNPPDDALERLSRELKTEVIWLAFQKITDAFEYQHWENGTRLRHLVFGCYDQERTWERVDGEPEAWESEGLFDPRRLERRIAGQRRMGPEFALPADEEAALRRTWQERRLAVDSVEPNIEARDAAEAVAMAYRLPGWQ